MIYKFIDNNGSEITVNSLSSLQALADSETVKKDTKVKAGLRGKWTTAENIPELVFEEKKEEKIEETIEPEGDIKSFITKEKKPEEVSTQPEEAKKEEDPVEKIEETVEAVEEEKIEEEKTEYELEEEEMEKTYHNENVIGLNFFDSIKICFNKYLVVDGRASRSEYWYYTLFIFVMSLFVDFLDASIAGVPWLEYDVLYGPLSIILTIVTFMPSIAVSIRRLHDFNKSGWWLLLALTIIGIIPLFIWMVSKGTQGKNRFGDYPLKLKRNK